MRGETVAEGGSPHACPVGVSKIRARRRVESLLNRPLAEILSSTAPAVVFAKEDSRRRKPHRSMSRHARVVEATPGADAVSSAARDRSRQHGARYYQVKRYALKLETVGTCDS